MKFSVIDVGSNSVRLMMWADGKTLYKRMQTTRLGEGLSVCGKLSPRAISRTALAVSNFKSQAEEDGAEKVYAFATAAVRSSQNGRDFVEEVKKLCGLQVEILSGDREAEIGLAGALRGGDGGIIDIGGASTEITLRRDGRIIYSKSVNIGTVRLFDLAGRDKGRLEGVIDGKISEFGSVPCGGLKIFAIGGTATRLAAIKHNITVYTPEITDGTAITRREAEDFSDRLLSMTVEQIRKTTICGNSAEVVGGGCLLLYKLMQKLGLDGVTVSESDNLEGYALSKEKENEK